MTTNQPAPQPAEAPTSDEQEKLLKKARAAQVAGTFPSDSAIRLLTDDYGWNESERRHCMAAARLALAYWGHAWGCLTTNNPALAPPAKGQAEDLAVLRREAAPVPVSERPWKNEAGWLDPDGECWWCPPEGPAYWSMANPAMVYGGWLLPAHAIPVPPKNRHHV